MRSGFDSRFGSVSGWFGDLGFGVRGSAEEVGTVLFEELEGLLIEQVFVALVHGLNLTGSRRHLGCRRQELQRPPRTRKSSLTLAVFRPWGSWARYRRAGNQDPA